MRAVSRHLAALAVVAAGWTGETFAICNEFGGFAIFQCAERAWFAPPPAGSGAVSGVWWQIGFGNEILNTGLGSNGTGNSDATTFNGNDSGGFTPDLVDARASLGGDARVPQGALCLRNNNFGNSGVDGCCDNFRDPNLPGGTGDDGYLNPEFNVYYWQDLHYLVPSNDWVVDYPMGALLRETSDNFFAVAAVATSPRTGPSDFGRGDFNFKQVSNGGANPITGRNDIIPWQRIPGQPDPGDPNTILVQNIAFLDVTTMILDLGWSPAVLHSDLSSRPSTNSTISNPGGGVGTADMGPLVRYVVEAQAIVNPADPYGSLDPNGWSAAATHYPPDANAQVIVARDTCVRLRTHFGKAPEAVSTTTANCRLGRCGDLGYDVIGGLTCMNCLDYDGDGLTGCDGDCDEGDPTIHSGAPELCNGVDDDCDGQIDEGIPGGCPCATLGTGLVSFWPGDGNADDIRGGHDGTAQNGLSYVAGRVGQAFSFDGLDDLVGSIGDPSTYSFIQNTGVFSIVAWMRLDNPAALLQQAITGNTDTTSDKGHFFIWENSDGLQHLRVGLVNATPGVPVIESSSGTNVITTSGWHHVAAVGDGTHVTFYMDGVGTLGTGTVGTLSTGDSNRRLTLGSCGGACLFQGEIDEVQIYDQALSAAEILVIYAAGAIGACQCTDADGDGYGAEGGLSCPNGAVQDCDDADAGAWSTPGEVPDLTVRADGVTLDWLPPAMAGASSWAYDALRTPAAGDFSGAATCVESDDGDDLVAMDATMPATGQIIYYLVRAENACPGAVGMGPLGTQSDGTPRTGRICP